MDGETARHNCKALALILITDVQEHFVFCPQDVPADLAVMHGPRIVWFFQACWGNLTERIRTCQTPGCSVACGLQLFFFLLQSLTAEIVFLQFSIVIVTKQNGFYFCNLLTACRAYQNYCKARKQSALYVEFILTQLDLQDLFDVNLLFYV